MKLVEMYFVFLLLSSFLFLTPVIQKNRCESKINYFIEGFNHDLHYGQSYSITHFAYVKLKLYPHLNSYQLMDSNLNNIKTVQYDKGLIINSYVTYDTIDLSYGYVNVACYFYLSCGSIKYKVTVYEKSGIINATKV